MTNGAASNAPEFIPKEEAIYTALRKENKLGNFSLNHGRKKKRVR